MSMEDFEDEKIDMDVAYTFREQYAAKESIGQVKKQIPVCGSGMKISKFGSGIFLFFDLILRLGIVFALITCLNLVKLTMYQSGNGLLDTEKSVFFSQLTLANFYRNETSILTTNSTTATNSTSTNSTQPVQTGNTWDGRWYSDYAIEIFYLSDIITNVLFLSFLFYYARRSNKLAEKIDQENITIVDYSIQIENIPGNCLHEEIHQLIQDPQQREQNAVSQIFILKKVSKQLENYQKMETLKEKAIDKIKAQKKKGVAKGKIQAQLDNYEKYLKNYASYNEQSLPSLKAFVTFRYQHRKTQIMKVISKSKRCCGLLGVSPFKLRGQQVKIIPPDAPSNINFENLEYTQKQKMVRMAVVSALTIFTIFIGFLIQIIIFSQMKFDLSGKCLVDYNKAAYTALQDPTDEQTRCYCRQLSYIDLIQETSNCQKFIQQMTVVIGMSLIAASVVFILNLIIRFILKKLTNFEKYYTLSEEIAGTTSKLFLSLLFNISIVPILANANIYGFQPANAFLTLFSLSENSESSMIYVDFTRQWYLKVGMAISNTMVIHMFSPHITGLIMSPIKYIMSKIRASKASSQKKANKILKPEAFAIHFRNAYMLMIVYVCMMFGGLMPYLYGFASVTFLLSWLCHKCVFTKYSSIPPQYDHMLTLNLVNNMGWSIFLNLMISIYAYGAEGMMPPNMVYNPSYLDFITAPIDKFIEENIKSQTKNSLTEDLVQRFRKNLIISMLLVVLLSVYIIFSIIMFFLKIFSKSSQINSLAQENISKGPSFDTMKPMMEKYSLITYDIKKNPKYQSFFELNSTGKDIVDDEKTKLKEQAKQDPMKAAKNNRVAPAPHKPRLSRKDKRNLVGAKG